MADCWMQVQLLRVAKMIDLCVGGDFTILEAFNMLKMGLLCSQANAILRPDEVV